MPPKQAEESRWALRVPVKARVKVHFANLGESVNAHAANLSLTGMFIRTQQQCPAGTLPNFELELSDDLALVKGVGEVVWSRLEDESEKRPAGMGVRFLQIDQDSQAAITNAVDRHLQRGGDPFELGAAWRYSTTLP